MASTPHSGREPKARRLEKRFIFIVLFLLLLGGLFFYTHRANTPVDKKGSFKVGTAKHPVPVTTAQAHTQNVPIQLQIIGNVQSVSSVGIKPQISGQVIQVAFKEGQFVHAGDVLFTIDPRPAQAALDQARAAVGRDAALIKQGLDIIKRDQATVAQAQAALKRDQAVLTYAQAEENRYLGLFNQQFVSREQYEQTAATAKSDLGTIEADKAAINTAKATLQSDVSAVKSARQTQAGDQALVRANRVNLQYYTVRAPFTGRTSTYLVHPGDAVQANTTSMTTLYQLNPTYVTFAVPEQQISAIKRQQSKGNLTVTATADGTGQQPHRGQVVFYDSTVDTTTGTILLKGAFDNPDAALWPGQFVTVILSMGTIPDAVVIPSQAVMTGQKGDYVFVVQHRVAVLRPVTVGRTGQNVSAITKGLDTGETVVTDGQLLLESGYHVRTDKMSRRAS